MTSRKARERSFYEEFAQLVRRRKAAITVVGLGYVGLPLALEFVRKGFEVVGIDVDKERIARIKKKESYITDIASSALKKAIATGRFSATCDFRRVADSLAVIICVPTPLKRKYSPDISYIKQAVRSIAAHIKGRTLVVLESTTYPGTTEEVILPLFEQKGLRHGEDFYLCFSPERIDPGNKSYPVRKIPKVVGGIDAEAGRLAELLYKTVIERVIRVSSARVAETVKLLENTFRLVNIGLVDELAMMAHRMKIDIWEIIEAAKTKPFGFMPFYPGPGVGGHCIPKDPLYLYWKARHHGISLRFVRLASEVVSRMPAYVAERLAQMVKGRAKVLVIGVTYKKDVKDLRKSPSLDLIAILQGAGYRVSYHDPLIPYLKFEGINLRSVALNRRTLGMFDCAVIATDHTGLDYALIRKHSRLIFDLRNRYARIKDERIQRL